MIQLKLRTEYTFGQTYCPLKQLINFLKDKGCTHAAIVDDDTWGHIKFFKACRAAGINPILGCHSIVSDVDDNPQKMWFLAKNTEGLTELYKALSLSYHQKMPTNRGSLPRLYKSDVMLMSDNIIKFAGDILDREFLKNCNNIYMDITENGSNVVNRMKTKIGNELNIPVVGFWDNYYITPEDKEILDFMPFGKNSEKDYSIQNPTINQDIAQQIAESCEGLELPRAPMIHMDGDIEKMCRNAIKERFGDNWTDEYEKRLQHELAEIKAKDFDSYFILVQDMIKWSKQHMLVGPSRGSSAGSLVCYLLHITEIDPIPPKLYFERFIDKTRKDLPDIDTDFPDNKREMVIGYLKEKWGSDHVAHVGNVALFKPKSALIQVGKKLEIPALAMHAVKEAIIERGEADARSFLCLEDTLQGTDAGKKFMQMYPEAGAAVKLEGHAVRTGIHAAGVLVCNEPISNYCVVDDKNIAHLDKRDIETVNLLKMDILGLRTLTVLEDCRVPNIDWYHLPLNDIKAYEIFNSGRLSGIFQFEGNALRSLSAKLRFKSITEIDAITALARPGPFNTGISNKWIDRHNGASYKSVHPLMAKLLKDSYELPLYQENTMSIVREIGNFDWSETAFVRKAISKVQGKEALLPLRPKFINGAISNGVDEQTAIKIWDEINAMGAWQMNKAHTYSYATISYWTAWLKGNYPLEFAATNLRHAKDEDSAIELLREFCREGYKYTYFDVNNSGEDWEVVDGHLLGGFKTLHGVGNVSAKKYIQKRNQGILSEAEIEKLNKLDSPFKDVFFISHIFANYYAGRMKVNGKVWKIVEIEEGLPHGTERYFLGQLVYKNQRDMNEDMLIKKRGGKRIPINQPTKFADVRIRDDSGMIGGRIAVRDYEKWGKPLIESLEIGSYVIVKAKFFHGIRYAFINKWRRLNPDKG